MKRRDFGKLALAGAAGTLAAPAVVRAQTKFNWRMTNAYVPSAPFYSVGPGSPTDLIKKIEAMSGGRLRIQHFGAGELVPAFGGFDAVVAGTVEANAANSYFWSGHSFAAQYFTTVPFGMSFLGHMSWLYHGGGLQLWHQVYEKFNCVAFPINNTGVQMAGWFRKPVKSLGDLKGLRMRIPGLAGKVYGELGVTVRVLPAAEIFPALERGVIDAAEFVGPYQDRFYGLHNAAKFYHTSGWHEPSTTGELLISKPAWDKLPADLKMVVQQACQASVLESMTWCEAVNGDALEDLVKNHGVTVLPFPDDVVKALRQATFDTLNAEAAKNPLVKKVHDSYMAFKAKHDRWAGASEALWFRQLLGV